MKADEGKVKPQEKQFEAWLVRVRADLRQLGVKTQEEQDRFISSSLAEDTLDVVRENLPPLGDYVRATFALQNAMDGLKHVQVLDPNEIRTDGGTQIRAGLKEEAVLEYAALMSAGVQFEAVIVFYDGENYWLADGFHRVAAAKRAARTFVNAEIKQGTRRDAVLYSVGANQDHGVQRTNADKKRAVETLLRDEEWKLWSDREIARLCGVSNSFVSGVRNELSGVNGEHLNVRKGRDGKFYGATRPRSETPMVNATPGAALGMQNVGSAPSRPGVSAFPEGRSYSPQMSGHTLAEDLYYAVNHPLQIIGKGPFLSRTVDRHGTPWIGYPLIQGRLINAGAEYKDYTLVDEFPPPKTKYWHGRFAICPTCSLRAGHEVAHDEWEGTESATTWQCPRCERRVPDPMMKIVEAPTVPSLEDNAEENTDPLLSVPGYTRLCDTSKATGEMAQAFFQQHGAVATEGAIDMALFLLQEQLDLIMGDPYGSQR